MTEQQLGERLASMESELRSLNNSFSEFKHGLGTRMETVEKHTSDHCGEIKMLFSQVTVLERSVYGFIGIVMIGVIGALVKTIIR